jgi:uncharacterized protein YqeY
MLRSEFTEALKTAMKEKDQIRLSTVRMVIAKLKERDIEARGKGNSEGISDPEIQQMLQGMVKQRRESIALYEQGGRQELADQERAEIAVIEGFLPKQMSDAELAAAVKEAVAAAGAASVKDMGKVMAVLKERHAGQMDFAKASAVVKQHLG